LSGIDVCPGLVGNLGLFLNSTVGIKIGIGSEKGNMDKNFYEQKNIIFTEIV